MVLGLSRSCVGLLHTPTGILSSSRLVSPVSQVGRRYAGASAAATKTKGPPTSKVSSKNAKLKSATTPKTSAKTPPSAATKASSLSRNADVVDQANESSKAGLKEELSDEEKQVKLIDNMMLMSHLSPHVDPWAQDIEGTLDVTIPRSGFPTPKNLLHNIGNNAKNTMALLTLAQHDSIPGIDLSSPTTRERLLKWPARVFSTQSVKPNSWLAPFRENALTAYRELNTAIASGDEKTAKQFVTSSYKKHVIQLMKKQRAAEGNKYIWRFHREVEPTRVLSLRVVEGNLAAEDPTFGNRLLIHALLQFDTEQSLEVYNRSGRALHTRAPNAEKGPNGSVPAIPKRVTEYLVMEKRMWYNEPWTFREQMWATA